MSAANICLQSDCYSTDWRYIGLDFVALTSAKLPADIMPQAVGRAIIDGAGIFAQYLEFYKWAEYYEDITWIRTSVCQR